MAQPTLFDFMKNSQPTHRKETESRPVRFKKGRDLWTDNDWREEYWSITQIPPKVLLETCSHIEDEKIGSLVDKILNGYHSDNRRRKERTPDDLNPDGKWYDLVVLLRMYLAKKAGKEE